MTSPTKLTSNAADQDAEGHRRGRVIGIIAGILLLAALLGVLCVVGSAWNAYRRSFDHSLPLSQRAAAASYAARLEPWNSDYAKHAVVMQKWSDGAVLLSQGADLPAMLELGEAYRLDVGNAELLADFKKAQQALSVNSNYKAHVQHAHEGPGGTLRPQDLLR